MSAVPRVWPRPREWDTRVSFAGREVIVSGQRVPGGRIVVFDPRSGRTAIAADPADYVYPTDVRVDGPQGLLYVKAHGFAGGFSEQTWLFKFDLRKQEIVERRRITNGLLRAECEMTADAPPSH